MSSLLEEGSYVPEAEDGAARLVGGRSDGDVVGGRRAVQHASVRVDGQPAPPRASAGRHQLLLRAVLGEVLWNQ